MTLVLASGLSSRNTLTKILRNPVRQYCTLTQHPHKEECEVYDAPPELWSRDEAIRGKEKIVRHKYANIRKGFDLSNHSLCVRGK